MSLATHRHAPALLRPLPPHLRPPAAHRVCQKPPRVQLHRLPFLPPHIAGEEPHAPGLRVLLPGAVAVAITTPSRDGIVSRRALFLEPVRLLLPLSASRAATPAQASFSTRFTFRITPSPSYGDGLAFILTSSRTFLGASNGFLGLFPSSSAFDEGDLADVSTVAVELDTHRDVALRDQDGNHVALDAGSIFSVASARPGVDLKAGVPITVN